MGGYSVLGGEYEISGKTKNQPKQFLSLRCKCYRKAKDQKCSSSIRVFIRYLKPNGQRVLNSKFIKSTKENYKHSEGCLYWSTNGDLAAVIESFDKNAFQEECNRIDAQGYERSDRDDDRKRPIKKLNEQHEAIVSDDVLEFRVKMLKVELDLKRKEVSLMQRELALMKRECDLRVEELENELNRYKSFAVQESAAGIPFPSPQTVQPPEDLLNSSRSPLSYQLLYQLLAQLHNNNSTED